MTVSDTIEDRARTRRRLLWLTGALLAAALAISWIRDPETFALFTGSLKVTTTPAGADVYLDGKHRGTTPLHISRSAQGTRTLLLTHRFHENLVEKVDIVSGQQTLVDRVLPTAFGSLTVVSNPKDGSVELDGERLHATTPVTLPEVSAGIHEVSVGYPNHRSAVEKVEVLPGQTTQVLLDLILVPWGTLTIDTMPEDAVVTLVGIEEEYQPGMTLPLGDYAIEVSAPGFPSVARRVRVGMGSNLHEVVLQRLQVPLQVNVVPADAEVTLEYERGGLLRVRPYANRAQVPMGEITLVARAHGYRTRRRTVNIGDQGASINMKLDAFTVVAGESFRDRLRSGGSGPLLTVIAPGTYRMGDVAGTGARDELPVHEVRLTQPFAVGVYETSAGEYARYQRAIGADASANEAQPDLPAVGVSFAEAQAYLRWLSDETGYLYRLPSEAEWEYFARAGVESSYIMDAEPAQLCDYANIADQSTKQVYRQWDVAQCTDGFARIAPVGKLKSNAFGLFDVSGNVSEWVADCWSHDYQHARGDEVPFQDGVYCHRIFRGGSWDSQPDTVRLSYRQSSDRANDDRGIRVLREL
jgi:formylglycine-generating enzyme required for sulfatase activity